MKKITIVFLFVAAWSAAALQAELVALYTFNNSADPREDGSPNMNTLTDPVNGGERATWGAAAGFEGSGGFTFDGNDRLIAPIDVNPGVLPAMTWGAWVRPDIISPGLRKIMGHDNGGWDRTIGLDNREGAFRYSSFNGFRRPVVGTLPAPANTTDWTFIAATYDASTVTVYVDLDASTSDDALESSSETASFNNGWGTFAIGGIRPDVASEGWSGAIDNVFVFDEVLDEERLSEIRRRGTSEILGIAEGDPEIKAAPESLFGDLTALGAGPGTVSQSVTIENNGETQNLNITGVAINGPDRALFAWSPPGTTVLAPGETTEIEVEFSPPVEGGMFSATLEVITNDLITPRLELPLDTTVTSDPNVEISFRDPLFGLMLMHDVPATVVRTVTIRNTGVVNTLNLAPAPALSGADAGSYTVSELPSIPPGEERDLEIRLTTDGGVGPWMASLEITTNDPDTGSVSLSLDAEIAVTPEASLLAFFCFDNEADPFEDLSGNENHITDSRGPDGPVYGASLGFEGSGGYEFSGDGDRLIVPIDVNPTALDDMTWGAWVRTDSLGSGLRKVMGHDNGGWDRTIGLDNRNQSFRYTSFTGFQRPIEGSPSPVNTTDWTFLAASYDQSDQVVTVYVDLDATTSEPLVSVTETGNFNSGFSEFSIGSLRPDNNAEGWNGAIDNVFVYEGLLLPEELEALRDGGKAAIVGAESGPNLNVEKAGDDLVFTWESVGGKLYNLRSSLDPTAAEPIAWPVFGGHENIAATPPLNTLAIPLPADPTRLFVLEAFDAPPMAVFSDDFESGQGGWTVGSDDQAGTAWEIGAPSGVGPAGANGGSSCFGTNIDANYAADANVWLRSPAIDLTTAGGATVNYAQFADIEAGFDVGTVSVLDASDNSVLAVLEQTVDGEDTAWEEISKSIPAAALGRMIKLEFRLVTDELEHFAGWYIDDVIVTVP